MDSGVGRSIVLESRVRPRLKIRLGFQPHEEAVGQADLARGFRPLPIGLPGAERGTDEDTDDATDEEPHEEVVPAVPVRRDDEEKVHATERAPTGIATR